MKLRQTVSLEQKQKLIMTVELQQSIKLLQINAMELNHEIHNAMNENPLLEYSEPLEIQSSQMAEQNSGSGKEVDWEEYFQNIDFKYSGISKQYNPEKEDFNFEKFSYIERSLSEYLLLQFHAGSYELSRKKIRIGEYLIDCINENGYLIIDEEYISDILNIKTEVLEEIINIIQTFDPLGVGARSVQECLLIQLQSIGFSNTLEESIVRNNLEDIANNRLKIIADQYNEDINRIKQVKKCITKLEPKPGRMFNNNREIKYITPDAELNKTGGEYIVKVSEYTAPTVKINSYYKKLLVDKNTNTETKEYIKEKLDNALNLVNCIEQRKNTIKIVTEAIVAYQKDFFDFGITELKPLTLRQIAERTGFHESTISRTVNGKYIQTDNGTYELKFFFKRGSKHNKGSIDDKSSEAIKKYIKQIIKEENKKKPLSDQKLVNALMERNINLARRTVAKYREELGIPSSSKRKEY
jgi:RNA polymerase sigma-54 factor